MTTRSGPIPKAALLLAIMAFLGLCALPVLPAARADVFVWAGGTGPDGDAWCNEDNWLFGRGYPGEHDTADMVLVGDMRTQDPVVSCTPPFAIGELIVVTGGALTVSDRLSVTRSVTVARGASLDVRGTLDGGGAPIDGGAAAGAREWLSCTLIILEGANFLLEGTLSLPCKLVIEPEGELRIGDGGLFEQTADVTNEIGGLIRLTSGSSRYRVRADVILGPYVQETSGREPVRGHVAGEHAEAQLQIERGHVLTNEIHVRGAMAIQAWSEP